VTDMTAPPTVPQEEEPTGAAYLKIALVPDTHRGWPSRFAAALRPRSRRRRGGWPAKNF